jgi:ANTAR domain
MMRTALGPTPWHANSSRSLVSQASPSVVTPAPTRPRTAGRGRRRDGSSSGVVGSGWVGSFMAASLSRGRSTRRLPRHTSTHAHDDRRRRENSSPVSVRETGPFRRPSSWQRRAAGYSIGTPSCGLADSLDALGQARWTAERQHTLRAGAKGILMERHSVDEADAFEMLRDQSRRANTQLADVAARCRRRPPAAAEAAGHLILSRLLVSWRDAEDRDHLRLVSLGVQDVGARDAAEPTRALSLADEFPDAFSVNRLRPRPPGLT